MCLQTHRKLDGPADSERRGYGAVHWTTETVSMNAFIWRGNDGRQVIDTPHHISVPPRCKEENKKACGTCVNVNLLISEAVYVSTELRTRWAAATELPPVLFKGIVYQKFKFHLFTTHLDVDGCSGDFF